MFAFYFIALIYVSVSHYIILLLDLILKGIILNLIINRCNLVGKWIIIFWSDLSLLFFLMSKLNVLIHIVNYCGVSMSNDYNFYNYYKIL